MRLDADPVTGRAIDRRKCSVRITERFSERDGVIVFDWTCVSCAFAFGFHLPTEDAARAMSAHHDASPTVTRHLSNAQRAAKPQIQIVRRRPPTITRSTAYTAGSTDGYSDALNNAPCDAAASFRRSRRPEAERTDYAAGYAASFAQVTKAVAA